MIVCPNCGHENPDAAAVCSNCQYLLSRVDGGPFTTAGLQLSTLAPETTSYIPRPDTVQTLRLKENEICLQITGTGESIVFPIEDQITLGRHTPNILIEAVIDLVPYGGYRKGVSRNHLTIRRTDSGLTIFDLGSSNGTWINDTRVPPYTPRPIKPGDHVRLGQLDTIFFW